jgi:single-stranded DNA-binding protein
LLGYGYARFFFFEVYQFTFANDCDEIAFEEKLRVMFVCRFEMEFWDSLAEIAGHHLKKGDRVYITGRVVVDTYMKNEVNQRTAKVC